ncbi:MULTISPECIES: hypothetical protein [unclassified Beijerinckia]|uniref:hypothetical protein n=1 Tax=unclassified Beijerinckia TaxID=2638183 RepID=UPI00089469BC|nr:MULTISPECIES: hypothetical protein [unclassified Beijerinckia]MDH7795980.1 hypothetical protein [Beijerinckia sp. GAS462]SEC24871.1 hypothetical protein SAMN05443249_2258 [Beijerinckia sp. 28-YEA-48]
MVQYYSGTSDGGVTTMTWPPQPMDTAPGQDGGKGTTPPPLGTAPTQDGGGAGNPPPTNAGGDPNTPPANGGDGGGGDGGAGGGGLLSSSLAGLLNGVVQDFHASIETASHDLGLAGTVHGVTHLGEAIGLGELGGDNLLTDVLDAPTDILSGKTGTLLTDLVHDVGNIVEATGNLVNGVGDDLSAPNGVLGVAGLVNGLLDGVGGPGETGLLQNILNTDPHGADDGHNHLLDVNVGDLGTGLSLGELNVLDGGSIQVPLVDGLHADALSGLVQNGPLSPVLAMGDLGGAALPDVGGITQLLPDILDHNNGHFLLS